MAIGSKGLGFLNRVGAKVVSHVTHLGDKPHLDKLIGPVKVLLDAYSEGEVSAVYLCYNKFVSTMAQVPAIEQLLPLSSAEMAAETKQLAPHAWDYIYEPDAQRSLTTCWSVMLKPWSTRPWLKTWRPSMRRAWWP